MDALKAEGWLESRAGSGLVVCAHEPAVVQRAPGVALGFDLPEGTDVVERRIHAPPGCPLPLVGGRPDLRLVPMVELSRAYGRALRGRGRRLVDYGPPTGELRLRRELAGWLAESRGLANRPERLLVTRGSQMALYLLARTLLRPGDRVGVEAWGYPPAWRAFRAAGAELVPLQVDEQGVQVDDLPDDLAAVYVTPHHQYPTGVVLSAPRRLRLLEWARARRVPIIEDDYDHEFHYQGPPVLPLAALDRHGVVIYVGTLSKAFAPGLRVGWVDTDPALIARLADYRRLVDRQGNREVETAVAELLSDGTLQRHIRRVRRIYAIRRSALLDGLADLPVTPQAAAGGLAVWCRSHIDPDAWAERAQARGVFFATARAFSLDHAPKPWLRLGFAGQTVDELGSALEVLRYSSK